VKMLWGERRRHRIMVAARRLPMELTHVAIFSFLTRHRWRCEASHAGRNIKRIVVAFEAGRDGFWLARWLRARC
jgi:hypothetical protein